MKALAAAALLIFATPTLASAACGSVSASSATQSCENGVRVIRQSPLALPRISPAQVRQLELQREQLAQKQRQADQAFALESRRLDQGDRALRNEEYLYRDAYSPLRQRRGVIGFGGLNAGITGPRLAVVGQVPVQRRRHR